MPLYICAQISGSLAASLALRFIIVTRAEHFYGTIPVGSNSQSFILEFVISFMLMFVISGVATDNRAVKQSYIFLLDSTPLC